MLPTDPKLAELSPLQEMWIFGHIMKKRKLAEELAFEHVKLLCSFIDPERAKKVFTVDERTESQNFLQDLAALDPNFNPSEYQDVLEE